MREYLKQLRPRNESYTKPVYKVQNFLQEGKLTPAEVVKRDSRIELFIQKLRASDPFELEDGNTVVLKHSQELEDAVKNADTAKMKSIGLTTHDGKSLAWGKLKKSTEFGGGTAGSGGGASGTKTAESGQCVYLQAIWNNPKTDFNDAELSSAYAQVYVAPFVLHEMLAHISPCYFSCACKGAVCVTQLGNIQVEGLEVQGFLPQSRDRDTTRKIWPCDLATEIQHS